jgi:hypothetical protein
MRADLRVVGAERILAYGGSCWPSTRLLLDSVVLYHCGRRRIRFVALADLFDHPLVG